LVSLSSAESDHVKALEREVRELRRADVLRNASAYFAQAEFDRRAR